VLLGSFPGLLPSFAGRAGFTPNFAVNASGQVQMPAMIMMIMLGATGLIILFAKTTAGQVTKASLFSSAASATIAVFGVVWMSSSFMDHNFVAIKDTLGEMVNKYPWLFAIALFTLSILLFSQAATTKALMPLGLVLGLSPAFLLGIFPAVNGHTLSRDIRPAYRHSGDGTGTTRIGKYVLNHSFMLPGLVTTAAAVGAGLVLQLILL
jgi:anaerobic C4-dicarboxylate transporter DcuA